MRFPPADANIHVCKFCGKEVHQNPGRKEKKFCDDKCRMAYWNSHQDKVERKAILKEQVEKNRDEGRNQGHHREGRYDFG